VITPYDASTKGRDYISLQVNLPKNEAFSSPSKKAIQNSLIPLLNITTLCSYKGHEENMVNSLNN
jgi:hypothetical protein